MKLTGLLQTTDMGEAPWGAGIPQHKGEGDLDAGTLGTGGEGALKAPVSKVGVGLYLQCW